MNIYGKRGIPIERGDVLKVYHFTGARRKRHYMYKQCVGTKMIGKNGDTPYAKISHLNLVTDESERDAYYLLPLDGRLLGHHEIVQSIKCDHEDRPRRPAGRSALQNTGDGDGS